MIQFRKEINFFLNYDFSSIWNENWNTWRKFIPNNTQFESLKGIISIQMLYQLLEKKILIDDI